MTSKEKKQRFISRSPVSEEVEVEYDCGEDTEYNAGFETAWRNWSPLTGIFVGFNRLDANWQWVSQDNVSMKVEGRAYVLTSTDSEGHFTLEPRGKKEGD
jgi:hypothetical protein